MGIFEKFKIGLSKSSKNLSEGFKNLVINKKILTMKIILVTVLIVVAILSAPILNSSEYTHFKHALEWNYFIGVVLFYFLSFLFWKKEKPKKTKDSVAFATEPLIFVTLLKYYLRHHHEDCLVLLAPIFCPISLSLSAFPYLAS